MQQLSIIATITEGWKPRSGEAKTRNLQQTDPNTKEQKTIQKLDINSF